MNTVKVEFSGVNSVLNATFSGEITLPVMKEYLAKLKSQFGLTKETILVLDTLDVSAIRPQEIRETMAEVIAFVLDHMARHFILVNANEDVGRFVRATTLGHPLKLHFVGTRREVPAKLNDIRGLTSMSGQ